MTVITLTTVGYGEIVPLEHNPAGRVFTMIILLFGAGTIVTFLSSITALVVEGQVRDMYRRWQMQRQIESLDNHYIVCGAGNTGWHAINELITTQRPVVVIETDNHLIHSHKDTVSSTVAYVHGDATEESVLRYAGLPKAAGIIIALPNDKDNLTSP